MRYGIVIIGMIWAGAAAAQEDPMELQRCIWRCLAGSPGAGSAQYNQCVEAQCVAAAPPPVQQSTVTPRTVTTGVTPGGTGRYVTVASADGQRSLTYLCDPAGQSYLALDRNVQGPGGPMALQVDTTRYQLTFSRFDTFLLSPAVPNAPVIEGMRRGQTAYVLRADGVVLATLSLSGVGPAIDAAIGHCFPG